MSSVSSILSYLVYLFFSICQKECQNWCQTECQKECQRECQNRCKKECQNECLKRCQIGCQNICQIECQKKCLNICQKVCQIECQNKKTITTATWYVRNYVRIVFHFRVGLARSNFYGYCIYLSLYVATIIADFFVHFILFCLIYLNHRI